MSLPPNAIVILTRGTKMAHVVSPFHVKAGNFSIVSDFPEMRFHDGVTPGGIVIPLDENTWRIILEKNASVSRTPFAAPQETFVQRLLRRLTGTQT